MVNIAPVNIHPSLVRETATPLANPADLDPLLDRIGDARFVLLGEASHGTSEYYLWRMHLTILFSSDLRKSYSTHCSSSYYNTSEFQVRQNLFLESYHLRKRREGRFLSNLLSTLLLWPAFQCL